MNNFQERDKEIKTAMEADIPHIYSNGFSLILGMGDVAILFKQMGNDVAILNLSYTLAKTLSEKLGGAIKMLESKTKQNIMTVDYIEKSFKEEVDDNAKK